MPHFLDRVRTVLRRSKRNSISVGSKESIWKRLPSDVFVAIAASCSIKDIGSLSLTNHLLHDRVAKLEFAIAWAYIQLRKQKGYHDHLWVYGSLSPGDDIHFISELFPPPPPKYSSGMDHDNAGYSLGYLGDLHRCWETCLRLSYHLADHVVEHHLETDPLARPLWASSKTEKEVVYTKAVASLQAKLLHPIAYAIFFLESSASHSDDSEDSDNHYHHHRSLSSSVQRQQSILQKAPFTDTQILLSTHHCMQLLFSTMQRLMSPEIPHATSESWVSLLLTTSTMERIVQFFVSIAKDDQRKQKCLHDSTWSHKKEFLLSMRRDLNEYMAHESYHGERPLEPKLNHIWFHAAQSEMGKRGAIPHTVEETEVHVLHGSVVKLECTYCYDAYDE
ncbi:hypothetical protein N7508_005389 [Penicillium antarcticum]|uniref:uncharacterized protein n=1 Tax=Penicillium antarcticum TaxID=416450 RepID=UPI00238549AC|nr:uncharacterized protein N7508_005389 [Penicillium antarcticum]KAJ5306374.1 hypothetical protein N7508_005389 [Penicillium antarcticum]